jgi:hypothetical protein
MAEQTPGEWIELPEGGGEKAPNVPGVYVMASSTAYPTILQNNGSSHVLYVGSAGNLAGRLRRQETGNYSHHLLGYAGPSVQETLPQELQATLDAIKRESSWRLFYCAFGEGKPGLPYTDDKGKLKEVSWWKTLEDMFLIQHFFQYGQYPPLNASSPGIKSIAAYWTDDWWKYYWEHEDWGSQEMWGRLKEKISEG